MLNPICQPVTPAPEGASSSDVLSCPSPYFTPTAVSDGNCPEFSLSGGGQDQCFLNNLANEVTGLGAADLHVFKLLGVHEQGELIDLAKNGNPISGGDNPNFSKTNAFTSYVTEWRSLQYGDNVIKSAYIGYDFGAIKLTESQRRYGVNDNESTAIKHDISLIKIKQSAVDGYRAKRVRIERSQDGIHWYGVSLQSLPDDCTLVSMNFDSTVPSRYWRIRPIEFYGTSADQWGILALEMFDYDATTISDIQDKIFMENRDRDYATSAITLKGTYDIVDTFSDFSQFGLDLAITGQMTFQIPFTSVVAALGRPLVIGDIFELPSEAMYDVRLQKILKYMEVTDVGWSINGYTPGWTPTILRVVAIPMVASQETQGIVGPLTQEFDIMGLSNTDDGTNQIYQDLSNVTKTIQADALLEVPELGADPMGLTIFTDQQIKNVKDQTAGLLDISKLNYKQKGYHLEDGMPPGNVLKAISDGTTTVKFTEGDTLPTNGNDGDYHRLNYVGTASDVPPRLFKFSIAKNRWIYMETDRRQAGNKLKPILQEYLSSSTRQSADSISK